MFLKKLFSHSLIYALGPQIPKVAMLFVLPVITRHLTSTDYGIYGAIASYVTMIGAVSDLGFSVVLVNSFYNYPNKWHIVWKQLHYYLLIWSLITGVILAGVLWFIMPQEARGNTLPIILYNCVPAIFFNSAIILGSRYYQFAQKPLYIASTSALVGVIAILLNLYTIAVLKLGYMGWFISTFVSSLVQFAFFVYPVFFKYNLSPLVSYRKRFLKANLKVSLPVIPHTYSSYLLSSSDRIVMDRMHVPVPEIGKYNLAYTLGSYFDVGGSAVGMAVGPIYTGLYAKRNAEANSQVNLVTHWLQAMFIIGGFMLSLWCREIIDILISNRELKSIYPLAIIIIMGYVYRPYYWAAVNRLQYGEKTSQLWKISFIAGLANLVLNIIFVPIYGIMGSAVITFISLLYMGFAGHFLRSFKQIESTKYYPILTMLVIIISTALAYLLKDAFITVKVLVTVLLIIGFVVYTFSILPKFKTINV